MGQVVLQEFVTLDGYATGPGGSNDSRPRTRGG
jgi:hypothetical protein